MTPSSSTLPLLAFTGGGDTGWIGRWSPGIGDPNVVGWVTVVGYLSAAILCWLACRRAERRVRAFWGSLAAILLLLGINKQLDLQTALTELGRILARSEGWYGQRRIVQVVFILVVAATGFWLFRSAVMLARGNLRQMRSVLLGTLFLISFVTIRAASFHHIDHLLGIRLGGVKVNALLELGGIALVIHGAWKALRAAPRELR